jgi:hypothetical protein
MADREAVGVGVTAHIGYPQWLGVADELAEHAASGGERPDDAAAVRVDPPGHEPRQGLA